MATVQQQKIPSDQRLVCVAAEYDDAVLDIYATVDEDGYQLARITDHGGVRDLMGMASPECIKHFEAWVERHCQLSPAARLATVRREIAGAYSGYLLQSTAA